MISGLVGTITKSGGVKVRGEDQLFSYKGVLHSYTSAIVSGAGGYIDSPAVPAGEVWILTTIVTKDATTATTRITLHTRIPPVSIVIDDQIKAFAANENAVWGGHTYLPAEGFVRSVFIGSLAGDTCGLQITGYRMTLEV